MEKTHTVIEGTVVRAEIHDLSRATLRALSEHYQSLLQSVLDTGLYSIGCYRKHVSQILV